MDKKVKGSEWEPKCPYHVKSMVECQHMDCYAQCRDAYKKKGDNR